MTGLSCQQAELYLGQDYVKSRLTFWSSWTRCTRKIVEFMLTNWDFRDHSVFTFALIKKEVALLIFTLGSGFRENIIGWSAGSKPFFFFQGQFFEWNSIDFDTLCFILRHYGGIKNCTEIYLALVPAAFACSISMVFLFLNGYQQTVW